MIIVCKYKSSLIRRTYRNIFILSQNMYPLKITLNLYSELIYRLKKVGNTVRGQVDLHSNQDDRSIPFIDPLASMT